MGGGMIETAASCSAPQFRLSLSPEPLFLHLLTEIAYG